MALSGINTDNFATDRPGVHFEPHANARIITELFVKVVIGFWRSCISYFGKVQTINITDSPVIRQFKKQSTIRSGAIIEYCNSLKLKNNKLVVCDALIHRRELQDITLPKPGEIFDDGFLFIPVVLKGTIRNHIVAIVYDKNSNRIEFYDSKGLTIQDHSEGVFGSESLKLPELLKKVAMQYGDNDTTLLENTTKHQYDCHNCGVYVLDYIERRLNGESLEKIQQKGLPFSKANGSRRREMFNKLSA